MSDRPEPDRRPDQRQGPAPVDRPPLDRHDAASHRPPSRSSRSARPIRRCSGAVRRRSWPSASGSSPSLRPAGRRTDAPTAGSLSRCRSSRRSTSPRDLAEAYAARWPAAPARPIAGGTDLMVALTGEIGEPPDAHGRPVAARRAARHRPRRRRDRPRRADDLHGHPPVARSAASTCPRWSRRPRRSARPRSRTAARSAATSPTPRRPATRCPSCSPLTRRSCVGRPRGERTVAGRASSGRPTGRRRSPRTSCSLRIRIPLAGRPRDALPEGRDAPGPGDQQGRRRARLARRRGDAAGAWTRRPARPRLRGGRPPIRARPPRPRSRAGHRRPRPPTRRRERSPPSSTRSTTSARPPNTAGSWPPGSSIG